MLENFIEKNSKDLIDDFLIRYDKIFPVNFDRCIKMLKDQSAFNDLTEKWYKYLNQGDMEKAYSVYDDYYYFLDLFYCYTFYSRKYLKNLKKSNHLKNIKSFVDLGCGIAYSTIALSQMFPGARAYATNLKNTKQWKFCKTLEKENNFKLVKSINEIDHNVDLVFASEYFEHIQNPIDDLKRIIQKINPKYLVVANAFNTYSIGHFENYHYKGIKIPQEKISKLFNRYLANNGYSKINTGFWNNRPTLWMRIES